jgi:NAD-dependent dihydropyrimidine dehydrogenase PreA subunit
MISASALNTLRYGPALCVGCGLCADVCPHGVFAMAGGVAAIVAGDSCMECGACQVNCLADAIAVESGVGCAAAMIYSALTGKREVTCG